MKEDFKQLNDAGVNHYGLPTSHSVALDSDGVAVGTDDE
eukprot:CAMPEP_0197536442 /NCGR_PEP_ID=MMETSP1318-20131121/53872_1 /TAXON_ID=552666 /ORGANISM="Partenskyella glossopodia, Strain RCC365" /LENGTH=38 /DNA_ID= /DNA_START= /DNA_END= /DNA_ORIENTATION=